jgi:undecaprenyl-diphosphatase
MLELSMVDAVVLGVVEGLTEFLPVSSTAHLTIAEKILGLPIDDPAVTAYTAIIQSGAIVSVILYFRRDLARLVTAFVRGLFRPARRDHDYRMAWKVGIASIPVGIVGFVLRDLISGPLRSLWVVAVALISWSVVIWLAERQARHDRGEQQLTFTDAIVIGLWQCVSLIPGVSRSGATISGGLFQGLDRVAATRLSFLMSVPALLAAGLFELKDVPGSGMQAGPILVGIVVAFVVAYASVAWLLRFVSHHRITVFIPYRVALGVVLLVALAAGKISAT